MAFTTFRGGVILLLVAFALAIGGQARAETFLNGLEGSWSGKGLIKTTEKGNKENIRCRLVNSIVGSGQSLRVNGNCAVSGFVFPVVGAITAETGSRYSSTIFNNVSWVQVDQFAGRARGARLTLVYKGRDRTTKKPVNASVIISKRGGKFDISLRTTDADTKRAFNMGTINFSSR